MLLGCGGDGGTSGPATCDNFTACGGNLIGAWHLAHVCPTAAALMTAAAGFKVCPQGTASIDAFAITGTTAIDGKGTWRDDLVYDVGVTTAFPTSCLSAGETCAAAEAKLDAQIGVSTASCQTTNTKDGCNCTYRVNSPAKLERSFVVGGTSITKTDPANGSTETSQFCVDGNTLRTKSDKDGEIDVWTR